MPATQGSPQQFPTVQRAAVLCALVLYSVASTGQSSPLALARQIQDTYVHGSRDQFDAIFPFEGGRKLVALADSTGTGRVAGLASVAYQTKDLAVLLIAGVLQRSSSAQATIESREFSGLYTAVPTPAGWRLSRQVPIDESNRIASHQITARVHPGSALNVTDRMRVEAGADYGFAVRLNHAAVLRRALWNGKPVRYLFGGGLFWADLPKGGSGTLVLDYILRVDQPLACTGSGCFLPHAGHVRDEYFWHPFFDFNSARDRANFAITVRIPKEYELSTSVPQSERVRGTERIIRGQSERPTFALSLFYDDAWTRSVIERNGVRLELFVAKDFTPSRQELTAVFEDTFALLTDRFGEPGGGYLAVVQARARAGGGWHFNSNQAIVTGGQGGGPPFRTSGAPRAFFSHEIAHLWTRGAGPATNFLQEGWARFAESLILRSKFGEQVERRFWEAQEKDFFDNFDGKSSILDDPGNSGVAYSKGAWIFKMLENILGEKRFNAAMRRFSQESIQRPRDWQELAACLSEASPSFDAARFLLPWLQQTDAPSLEVRIEGSRIIVKQGTSPFFLPVQVEYQVKGLKRRRSLLLQTTETSLDAGEPVENVILDPDHLLLLKR